MFNKLTNKNDGFTLVELLIVVAIVAVLFAIVFVAVDPAGRLAAANNAVRQADTREIVEATQQYIVDNDGSSPWSDDDSEGDFELICEGDNSGSSNANCSDPSTTALVGGDCSETLPFGGSLATDTALSADNLVGTYLATVPVDPVTGVFTDGDTYDSDYALDETANGLFIVASCEYDGSEPIYTSR